MEHGSRPARRAAAVPTVMGIAALALLTGCASATGSPAPQRVAATSSSPELPAIASASAGPQAPLPPGPDGARPPDSPEVERHKAAVEARYAVTPADRALAEGIALQEPLMVALQRDGGRFAVVSASAWRSADEGAARGVSLTLESPTRASAEDVTVPALGAGQSRESFRASYFDVRRVDVTVSLTEGTVVHARPDDDDGVGRTVYLTAPPSSGSRD